MGTLHSLRPRAPSADYRAAARLAIRLAGDAAAYGFHELAARCKERAHELDKDARRAELHEQASRDRLAAIRGAGVGAVLAVLAVAKERR